MGETHEHRETSGVEPEAQPVETPEGEQATPEDFDALTIEFGS